MKNNKKLSENQPGKIIASTGPGPSNPPINLLLRPQNLSPGAAERDAKLKKLQKSEKVPMTDISSLASRTLRSTSAGARRLMNETASTRGSTMVQSALSSDISQLRTIQPPLSGASTVEDAEIEFLNVKRLSSMEIPTPCALARPSMTGKQLSVTDPQELTRTVKARAAAAVDPALHALGRRIERDPPIDTMYSSVSFTDNLQILADKTAANFSTNRSDSQLDPTKPAFIPLQNLQLNNELEPLVLSNQGRYQSLNQESTETSRFPNRQVTTVEVPTPNLKFSSTTPTADLIYETKLNQVIVPTNNNNNIINNNNIYFENPLLSSVDPVALLPGYEVNSTQVTIYDSSDNKNNKNNKKIINNINNHDQTRNYRNDTWYTNMLRSPQTWNLNTANTSDSEPPPAASSNKDIIQISNENLKLQSTILESIMLSHTGQQPPRIQRALTDTIHVNHYTKNDHRHILITNVSQIMDSFLYLIQDDNTTTTTSFSTLPPLHLPLDISTHCIEIRPMHSFIQFPLTYEEMYTSLLRYVKDPMNSPNSLIMEHAQRNQAYIDHHLQRLGIITYHDTFDMTVLPNADVCFKLQQCVTADLAYAQLYIECNQSNLDATEWHLFFSRNRNIQREYRLNLPTQRTLSDCADTNTLTEMDMLFWYKETMLLTHIVFRRVNQNVSFSPDDVNTASNFMASLPKDNPLRLQHPAEVLQEVLRVYRCHLPSGFQYLQKRCYNEDEWTTYTRTGILTIKMKNNIARLLSTSFDLFLKPRELLQAIQQQLAPFNVIGNATTWPIIVQDYLRYSGLPPLSSKTRHERPVNNTRRNRKIHKTDTTSSDSSHRTSKRGEKSTMLNKLMDTIVGMGQQIQAQTVSQTEVVTAAIATASAKQRIEIIDLISISSDKLEEKMQQSNDSLRNEFKAQIQLLEQHHLQRFARLDEARRDSAKSPMEALDDRFQYNQCHHEDWILDSQVVGWKEAYLAEWNKLNPTTLTAFLPPTTAATERGLHHALQRMREHDIFPCDPVYSAEKRFFQYYTKVMESPIIQDGIVGIIGKASIKAYVYFHYHGTVHFPVEGEPTCPYSLSICRGQVQLSGATLRDGKTSGPVMLNEYMWNSDENRNNIEFSENNQRHDIGRMRTNRYIEEGSEWFLEYDKHNKDYDWQDAHEYRTRGILANLATLYTCLSWNTKDQQDEVRWAMWLMQQLDTATLTEVLRGIAQPSATTALAVASRFNFPIVPQNLVSSTTQLHMVLRIMVEAFQVANGTHGKRTKHNNIDAPFDSVPLHSVIFRLHEYQLEQGFRTRRDPERENKKDDAYFISIVESMRRLGLYIYNYRTDSRMHQHQQVGYTTRNSVALESRERLEQEMRLEQELRGLLHRKSEDNNSPIAVYSLLDDTENTSIGVTDRTSSISSKTVAPIILKRNTGQSHLKQTTIPIDWSKPTTKPSQSMFEENPNNSHYNPTLNSRGEHRLPNPSSALYDTTIPLTKPAESIFQETAKFKPNRYVDYDHENFYQQFNPKEEIKPFYKQKTTGSKEVINIDDEDAQPVNHTMQITPATPPRGAHRYVWRTLQNKDPIADLQLCNADYFRDVKYPYQEILTTRPTLALSKCDVRYYYSNPNALPIHQVLNNLRAWCYTNNKTIHEWGTAIYMGIIFNSEKEAKQRTSFEILRDSTSQTVFIDPEHFYGANYNTICEWIENMLFAILKKWRKPITADAALSWLSKTKLATGDFRYLKELSEQVKIYAGHLLMAVNGVATSEQVLRYIQDALRRTDIAFPNSNLFTTFMMRHNLNRLSFPYKTESERMDVLETTIDHHILTLTEMDLSATIGATTDHTNDVIPSISSHDTNRRDRRTFRNNSANIHSYQNENTHVKSYHPTNSTTETLSIHSYHPNFTNVTEDELSESDMFTELDLPHSNEEWFAWENSMEKIASQCISGSDHHVLVQRQVQVTTKMGTGVPTPYRDNNSPKLCIACGDERHFVDRCYASTHDGLLSLPALAFLDEKLCERKLSESQKEKCSLHGQPPEVISTIRNIVTSMRKNLTPMDREINARNKRDALAKRNKERAQPGYRVSSPPFNNKKASVPVSIPGSTMPLRVTEESASIKSIRQQEIIDKRNTRDETIVINAIRHSPTMFENTLSERIDALQSIVQNKADKVILHEGQGFLAYHNLIRSVNGVDTTDIEDALLMGHPINNNSLTFLNLTIRGVRATDGALLEAENYKQWIHDTSLLTTEPINSNGVAIQMDNGGARTVASRAFATHVQAPVIRMEHPASLTAFNKTTTQVDEYAVFIVIVTGLTTYNVKQTREFRVTALIAESDQPFILGAEAIAQQNIIFDAHSQQATFFANEIYQLKVPYVAWSTVQSKMQNNPTLQRAININLSNEGGNNNSKWASVIDMMTHDSKTTANIEALLVDDLLVVDPTIKSVRLDNKSKTQPHSYDTIRNLFNAIQTDPVPVLQEIKVPYARWMIFALILLSMLFNQPAIYNYSKRLNSIVCNSVERRMRSERAWGSALTKLETYENIEFIKLLMQNELDTLKTTITTNVMSEVSAMATEIIEDNLAELEEARREIASLKLEFMTPTDDSKEFERPVEFPEQYWQYVFVNQRQNVIDRFNTFRTYPATDTLAEIAARGADDAPIDMSTLPQNRLEEVLRRLFKIDISIESSSRALERDLIMAQCLANIDRYAHPDPNNPAKAKASVFHINLKNPLDPPCFRRSKRLAPPAYWSLRCRIDYMVLRKEIALSTSSWNSPPMMVPQSDKIQQFIAKHGDNAPIAMTLPQNAADVRVLYRFTSDLRCVNERTFLEIHPLPLIPTLLDTTRGSSRYSVGDIEDAFFTCVMDELSRKYTAFSAVDNHYEYIVMPMGAKNSANHFAHIVQKAFGDLKTQAENSDKKMFFYQDDILNYSKTLRYQLLTQQDIYNVLRDYNLLFKIIKTHFNYKTQRVLGHVLTADGRLPDPSLTKTIRELVRPTSLQGIQSLLGLAQVAREYIPALSTLIAPLQALSKKGIDVELAWQAEQQHAFELLKKILTTPPSLLIPDLHKPFRVHVDACRVGKGIGAVLLQLNSYDKYQPVAYWSRGLIPAERNYSATELECTALHDTILHWQVYLLNGRVFDVIVDHYALVYMVTKAGGAEAQQRLLRLCLDLQQFTFNVIHRSGKDHLDADAVSRLLGKDDQPYVRTANELRDDTKPLTPTELEYIAKAYGRDCDLVSKAIDEGRATLAQQRQRIENIKVNSNRILTNDQSTPLMCSVHNIVTQHMAQVQLHNVERLSMQQLKHLQRCKAQPRPYVPTLHVEPRPLTHSKETQFFADQQWLYRQQKEWSSKFPTKLKLKLLAQLSTTTLREFMKDSSILPKIKKAIELELHKRHRDSTMNPKEVSTSLLNELLNDEPHIEHFDAVSELFRRQRSKQHRSLLTYPDEQLETHANRIQQHYTATANQHYTMLIQRSLNAQLTPAEIQAEAQLTTDLTLHHASTIHTERQQVLAERKRRETALEDKQRKDDEIQKQQRRDLLKLKKTVRAAAAKNGEPRKSNKRNKTPEDEEMIEESICTSLEQYDWLVHQLYNDPTTAQQYEIINVYNDKSTGAFMSTARPILYTDLLEEAVEEEYQRRAINGSDGTLELVNLLSRGQRTKEEVPWPKSEMEWVSMQEMDPFCQPFLAVLTTSTMKQLNDPTEQADNEEETDYFFRPLVENAVGALHRRSTCVKKDSHDFTRVTIRTEVIQKVVPQQLKQACLFLLHDQLGHPGKQRTIDTTRLNYYWQNMHTDIQKYVQDCNFCKKRKAHNFRAKVPIQEYFRMSRPMDRMHADLAGPFPITDRNNKYVLIIKDALTKFLISVPLPD